MQKAKTPAITPMDPVRIPIPIEIAKSLIQTTSASTPTCFPHHTKTTGIAKNAAIGENMHAGNTKFQNSVMSI